VRQLLPRDFSHVAIATMSTAMFGRGCQNATCRV